MMFAHLIALTSLYYSVHVQSLDPKSYVPKDLFYAWVYTRLSIYFVSLNGYLTASSFLNTIFFFFFVVTCSTQTSFVMSFVNVRMNLGSQSSEAMPRSLQQRIRALDLQPSVAVGMPSGSKYCCSPRAMETSLQLQLVPF